MSVYDERREELEQQQFMMGPERGRLSVTLDLLTDALVLVGQHGVYCQSARQPGKPAMDIQMISKCLTDAKELVADVMGELKRKSQLVRSGGEVIIGPDKNQSGDAEAEHEELASGRRLVAGFLVGGWWLRRVAGGWWLVRKP